MLKTVLENLIDNAEKYSDYGSDITINVSDDVLSISNQCSSFDRENLSNCGSLISEPQREIIRAAAE